MRPRDKTKKPSTSHHLFQEELKPHFEEAYQRELSEEETVECIHNLKGFLETLLEIQIQQKGKMS